MPRSLNTPPIQRNISHHAGRSPFLPFSRYISPVNDDNTLFICFHIQETTAPQSESPVTGISIDRSAFYPDRPTRSSISGTDTGTAPAALRCQRPIALYLYRSTLFYLYGSFACATLQRVGCGYCECYGCLVLDFKGTCADFFVIALPIRENDVYPVERHIRRYPLCNHDAVFILRRPRKGQCCSGQDGIHIICIRIIRLFFPSCNCQISFCRQCQRKKQDG